MNNQESRIDRDAVARRAYEIYMGRGGEHGLDQDDWYRAEAELLGKNRARPVAGTDPEPHGDGVSSRRSGATKTVRAKSTTVKNR